MLFPDDAFDAVWCANVLMYISDDDLPGVLAEFQRVVKPGGLVASKESDGELMRSLPIPIEHRVPFHHVELGIQSIRRSRLLLHWYRRAGLVNAWAKSVLVERCAPLGEASYQHVLGLCKGGNQIVQQLGPEIVSDETKAYWEKQADPDSPECILNHPDFAFAAAQVVTVGAVPE